MARKRTYTEPSPGFLWIGAGRRLANEVLLFSGKISSEDVEVRQIELGSSSLIPPTHLVGLHHCALGDPLVPPVTEVLPLDKDLSLSP